MPNFYDIEVTKGANIIEEGKPAEKVFIIKDGEFQVTKKLWHKSKETDCNIQDILEDPQRATKMNN